MVGNSRINADRRSMRMIWKTLRPHHVGLAFFWACSMLTFRSSLLLEGPADNTSCQTLIVIVSFVANMTTLFLIASRIERNPAFYDRLKPGAFTALIIIGLVLLSGSGPLASMGLLPESALAVPIVTGAVLAGAGYGYYWGSWAEYLGRMHPSRTSFYIPVVLLLTASLFVVISICSDHGGVPALLLIAPLPVLSQLCLARCKQEVPEGRYASNANSDRYRTALGSLVSLIVSSLVLSCLFGFVWQMTVVSVGSADDAHRLPLIANIIAAAGLIALVLLARKRIDLSFAFRVIVPGIVVLFAIMPLFWESNPVMLNVIMSTGYGMFDVIIWYMVISTAYDFAVSGFVIGGIVRALSIIARLVGIGIGYVIMLIPERPSMLIVGISVGAVYVLAMLLVLQSTRHRFSFFFQEADARQEKSTSANIGDASATLTGQIAAAMPAPQVNAAEAPARSANRMAAEAPEQPDTKPAATGAGSMSEAEAESASERVYDQIAEYYGLTRREAEVLPYLARGRSAKVIADALFVSESTIRTHTRRILEKTALHSKQELIDLIDRYE